MYCFELITEKFSPLFRIIEIALEEACLSIEALYLYLLVLVLQEITVIQNSSSFRGKFFVLFKSKLTLFSYY